MERTGEGWRVNREPGSDEDGSPDPSRPPMIRADVTPDGLSLDEAVALAQALLTAVEESRS
jgi:hypothetical protein